MPEIETPAFGEKPLPRTGPLGLAGILDLTFLLCRERFWKLVALGAVQWFLLPLLVTLPVILVAGVSLGGLAALGKGASTISMVIAVAIVVVLVVAIVLAGVVGHGAMIYAVSRFYWGGDASIGESFRFGLSQLGRLLSTFILLTAIIIGLTVACGVTVVLPYLLWPSSLWAPATPWVIGLGILWGVVGGSLALAVLTYVPIRYWLSDKVVVVESLSGVEALKRSWRLTAGKAEGPFPRSYWVRLSVLMVLVVLITVAVSMVFSVPGAIVQIFAPEMLVVLAVVVKLALETTGNLLGGLFGTVCGVVFYYDVRIRKEGLDLQVQIAGTTE